MNLFNISDGYDNSTNCSYILDVENDDVMFIIIKLSHISVFIGVLLLSVIESSIWTILKPLLANE